MLHFLFNYISAKPAPVNPAWNFLRPFSSVTWLCILASIFTFTLVLNRVQSLKSALAWLMSLSYFFGQSELSANIRLSSQILLCSWMVYSVFLISFYDGILRAYLMATDLEKVVDSDQDILSLGRSLYIAPEPAMLNFFLSSPFDRQRKIGEKVTYVPDPVTKFCIFESHDAFVQD